MKKLQLLKLQNSEHLAFFTDVVALLNEANLPQLQTLKTKIAAEVQAEDDAQKQILKSAHTQKLESLDARRDEIFRGFVLRLQSEQLAADEARRDAANRLLIVTDTYGNINRVNLQKETTEINNMLQDLNSDKYRPDVATVAVEDWIVWLTAANTDFNDLYTDRRDEYAAMPDFDMKKIRKTIDADFDALQQTIAAMEILNPSPELETLRTKLDSSIQQWKDTLAQRQGRRDDDSPPGV